MDIEGGAFDEEGERLGSECSVQRSDRVCRPQVQRSYCSSVIPIGNGLQVYENCSMPR